MNLLLDRPPKTVEVHGRAYPIRPDFRTAIAFSMLMTDAEVEEKAKIPVALSLFYDGAIPADLEEAVRVMIWFFRGGEEERTKQDKRSEGGATKEAIYSYEHDADLIYAAFLQQYGIDLIETDLHWWVFRALFSALGDDTEIKKVMGYRAIEITSDMSKSQKEFYKKMKKVYRIPLSKSEQDKQDKLEEILKNGGDVSSLLNG